MRWGLGPVFLFECLINSRRWQTYALRSAGVAALLLAMTMVASASMGSRPKSWSDYAELGQAYFATMIGVELALVMLAAPAATAGTLCVDRARGTLAHMLMTDLSDAEIVLGKLAARLLPVFGLVACTWPVMAISTLLGGIDPIALSLALAIIVAVAILGCTMALAVSVWARKSHEVILATYTVFILALLLWPIWYLLSLPGWVGPPAPWSLLANPFYVAFAPYADPGKLDLVDYLIFFGGALGASALLIGLAVWRMRPVACRGRADKTKRSRMGWIGRMARWLPGPSLDRNPVFWRECHRTRPSPWMTSILILLMGTTGALCLIGAAAVWKNGTYFRPGTTYWEIAGVVSYVLHVTFGLLLLSAVAPTSMAEERQRGSLDILAVTALSTRSIVVGKWLGTFRLALLMAVCPGVLVLALATARSDAALNILPSMSPDRFWIIPLGARLYGVLAVVATIVAHGALLTSLGLVVAVWIKRQSRAIALSVGSFVAITAAWPIVVTILGGDRDHFIDLRSLSPVVTCVDFVSFFAMRIYAYTSGALWRGSFWSVEILILALGLLGLAVRTFDARCGRIPEEPPRISVWTVVVLMFTGMISAGSLVTAITTWLVGLVPGESNWWRSPLGVLAYSLVIAIGLVLVAAEAIATALQKRSDIRGLVSIAAARSFVLARWWEALRLVLHLAIGPAVLALALATAQRPLRYEPQYTTNPKGVKFISSYVLAKDQSPPVGEITLGRRLLVAAAFLGTVLAHGGAAISVGLVLAPAKWSSNRSRAVVLGLFALMALALSVYFVAFSSSHAVATGGWSFLAASNSLLTMLGSRVAPSVGKVLWPVVGWDLLVALGAVAICWWAAWAWRFELGGETKRKPPLKAGVEEGLPVSEVVLAGD
jgi:hypothetical protein